jgi:DNA invertase Pin-like site-specific DNA recombinase
VRAAIYARYSSENQREASIEDQVRTCKARIEAEGWNLVATYTDYAQSGASHLRPGYQKLLADGRRGMFDVAVAEALDRLSRDQEHVAALFKHLNFAGVKIVTLAEGEIGPLHVGLKGTMNALYLTDLRQKVWRGLEGRIRQGRSGGGLCYGYDIIRELDERGEPVCGKRVIDEAEAAVVRCIFATFATGKSPRAIARELNADCIPGPGDRPWSDTTIRGHTLRRTGILHNDLYVGRLRRAGRPREGALPRFGEGGCGRAICSTTYRPSVEQTGLIRLLAQSTRSELGYAAGAAIAPISGDPIGSPYRGVRAAAVSE